jgi:hypothetical protein
MWARLSKWAAVAGPTFGATNGPRSVRACKRQRTRSERPSDPLFLLSNRAGRLTAPPFGGECFLVRPESERCGTSSSPRLRRVQIALDSLADLPAETLDAVEEPIREFCRSLELFVGHLAGKTEASRARG